MKKYTFFVLIILISLLVGCQNRNKDNTPNKTSDINNDSMEYTYDFEEDLDGWTGGYAGVSENYSMYDYDVNFSDNNSLLFDGTNKGIYLTNNNVDTSKNDYMYTTKNFSRADGLLPLTNYLVDLKFDIAPSLINNIENVPYDKIQVKAGVVNIQPTTNFEKDDDNNYYYIDLDDDNSINEENLTLLGNAAIEGLENKNSYIQKSFNKNFEVMTNSNGELWVIIGINTNYDGDSSLFIDNVSIKISNAE
jgi:hypothetical protein